MRSDLVTLSAPDWPDPGSIVAISALRPLRRWTCGLPVTKVHGTRPQRLADDHKMEQTIHG
jgi:hypothetical protein